MRPGHLRNREAAPAQLEQDADAFYAQNGLGEVPRDVRELEGAL